MTATPILFLHSAGPQGATDGSGPLLSQLRAALPEVGIDAPGLPSPEDPDPAAWEDAVRAALTAHDAPVVIVGHSLGGAVALRVLAVDAASGREHPVTAVVTVNAPCWDAADPEWPVAEFGLPDGAGELLAGTEVRLLHGTADEVVAPVHAERLAARLPSASLQRISGMDHGAQEHAEQVGAELRELTGTA